MKNYTAQRYIIRSLILEENFLYSLVFERADFLYTLYKWCKNEANIYFFTEIATVTSVPSALYISRS